jgi:hypothetical protein
MNKIALLILTIIVMFSLNAFAGETIEVQADSDTNSISDIRAIMKLQIETGGILMPCEEQMMIDMKRSGKTDKDIENFRANPSLQEKCKCINENKIQLAEKLKEYDTIISRHPDWKGKTVVVKEKNGAGQGSESTDTAFIEDIRQQLSECH